MTVAPGLLSSLFYALIVLSVGFGFVMPVFWASLASLAWIFFLARLFRRIPLVKTFALPHRMSHWGVALLFYFAALLLCALLQRYLTSTDPQFKLSWRPDAWKVFWVVPLQSLCEEIIFRALLLKGLLDSRPAWKTQSIVCVALLFSLAHLLNYALSAGVFLNFSALFALFLLGLAGNVIFVQQGHLAGAWGFHAGWNTVRFALDYQLGSRALTEAETFNVLEGSIAGLLVSFCVLWISLKSGGKSEGVAKVTVDSSNHP